MVVFKALREFAGSTSLHGFSHLVCPKSSPRTKTIWALSLIAAIIYASYEMRNSVMGKLWYVQIHLLKFELTFLSILSIYSIMFYWNLVCCIFLFICFYFIVPSNSHMDRGLKSKTKNSKSNFDLQVGLRIP